MGTTHTTARGTEPFDKNYCVGYQVHHEDWSPYPRINRLRQTFLDRGYDVDVERLRLVTESYKAHEGQPEKLKVAYAFDNVLRHCGIYIYEDDLIVGDIASPVKSAPIYPEFSVNWILDEIQHHPFEEREHDQFYIRNDKERQEILDLCSWWQGKTLDDYINVRLDDDQLKGSEAGKKIYQTNLYHYAGTGHLAVDYARLMRMGFGGILRRAEQKYDCKTYPFCQGINTKISWRVLDFLVILSTFSMLIIEKPFTSDLPGDPEELKFVKKDACHLQKGIRARTFIIPINHHGNQAESLSIPPPFYRRTGEAPLAAFRHA